MRSQVGRSPVAEGSRGPRCIQKNRVYHAFTSPRISRWCVHLAMLAHGLSPKKTTAPRTRCCLGVNTKEVFGLEICAQESIVCEPWICRCPCRIQRWQDLRRQDSRRRGCRRVGRRFKDSWERNTPPELYLPIGGAGWRSAAL